MRRLLQRDSTLLSCTWATAFYLVPIGLLAFFCIPINAGVEQKDSEFIIGIDLGTTYSSVGVMQNGLVEILANDQGHRLTPSYIAFQDEEYLIGDTAKSQYAADPSRTIFGIKRLIGHKFEDKGVQTDARAFPFKVVNKDGKPYIEVDINNSPKILAPEEVSAMILGKMKDIAEGYLGKTITYAVVTVPAYFNDAQCQATKDAGTIAGLNVLRVVKEPIAAAIAYGLDNIDEGNQERLIIVYDLGGSTLDVTLLCIENGVFEVLATAGNAYLGGKDFNYRVMEFFINQYNNRNNVDITKDVEAIYKLNCEIEKAKRTLSSQMSTHIKIEAFYNGRDFSETLTRAKFEELNMDLFKKTLKPVEQVLKDAKVKKSEVDHIILAGGSTRIPTVQALVEGFFDGKKASHGINPDEAVVFGAAIQGNMLSHPYEGCALGKYDLNPLTLGIETAGGVMAEFIPRNKAIPYNKSRIFSTTTDNQSTILIQVFEGERLMTKDNNLLGKLELTGIPPAPRGVPKIEVSFDLDANGILKVSASDKSTNKEEWIRIYKDDLTLEEINHLVMEAEAFAEEDKSVKTKVEALNRLKIYNYSLKNQLNDKNDVSYQIGENNTQTILDSVEVTDWLEDHIAFAFTEDFEEYNSSLKLPE